MKLSILGSSSSGNAYILHNDTSALIIEAGVSMKKIKKALDFNISKVVGCLISHSHGDHSKYISDVMDCGIKVYLSEYTEREVKYKPSRLPYIIENKTLYQFGEFKVMPLEVKHDVYCFSFLIRHPEFGKMAFITDTAYMPYKLERVNQLLIECNYSDDILSANVQNGSVPGYVRGRTIATHMSIDTCKKALRANDLSQVNNIVLIHLSDKNSDAQGFKKQVEDLTGKRVTVANKNIEIDFNLTSF